MADPPGARAAAGSWPPARVAWWGLAVLSLANILSYLDRIIVNLLIQPIQADLKLTDTRFSLLQGLAFGLFYATLALPIGRLVDGRPRKWIIVAGVATFSLFSLLTGLARGFGQFFLARVGVGSGEASVVPAGYSLISDYFPPDRLGRAIGVFTMTAFIGIGLAYVGGGVAIAAMTRWNAPGVLATLAPWRRVFLLIAMPGALVVVLLALLPEPARQGPAATATVPVREVAAHVRRQRAALAPLFAGFMAITMVSYATTAWLPAVFIRAFHWAPAGFGLGYGTVFLLCGPAGALFAGQLSDRLGRQGMSDAPLRVAAWGFSGASLFGALAPLMPDARLALAMLVPATFLSTMPFPMAGTAIQLVTPNRLRGQVSALYMLVINLVGLGLGPLVVGLFSDHLFRGADGVRYSLACLTVAGAPVAVVALMRARAPYRALRGAS